MDNHGQKDNEEANDQNSFNITLTNEQLGRLTNTDPSELLSQLTKTNEQGENLSQEEQFNIISNRMSEAFNNVSTHKIGQGKRTAYNELKAVISDTFGIEKKGDINDMLSTLATTFESKSNDTTKSKLSNPFEHEEVKGKLSELQKALESEKNKFNEFKQQQEYQSVWSSAMNNMVTALEAKGANFSADPNIKKNQIEAFSTRIKSIYDLKQDGEKVLVYDKNGTPVDNGNHLPISLAELAIQNSLVDFNTNTNNKKGFFPNGTGNNEKGFRGFTIEEIKQAPSLISKIRQEDPERAKALSKAYFEYRDKNK
jgi:hypothetical protein